MAQKPKRKEHVKRKIHLNLEPIGTFQTKEEKNKKKNEAGSDLK